MVAHVRVPRWPQSPQRPSVPRTQAPTHSLPGIILTLEGTPGGEVPSHMARLVKTQISDPQASASTISCPAPGDAQEAQSWNAGPSELRKRPEGIPLIFPKKAAGAQRDEVTCPESHNCLEM